MASNTDAEQIRLGGLNLYGSDDGGATFYALAGYVGGPYSLHVDMQDFRNIGNTTWLTCDGGIYRSQPTSSIQPGLKAACMAFTVPIIGVLVRDGTRTC
jgi:hypothetical protein